MHSGIAHCLLGHLSLCCSRVMAAFSSPFLGKGSYGPWGSAKRPLPQMAQVQEAASWAERLKYHLLTQTHLDCPVVVMSTELLRNPLFLQECDQDAKDSSVLFPECFWRSTSQFDRTDNFMKNGREPQHSKVPDLELKQCFSSSLPLTHCQVRGLSYNEPRPIHKMVPSCP